MNSIEKVKEDIDNILQLKTEIVSLSALATSNFYAVTTDKNIPLADRWELFCGAPEEMKTKKRWMQHIKIGGKEICVGEDGPDYYCGRGGTVEMVELVREMEEGVEEQYDDRWTAEHIVELKEYVLKHNLHSFVYDW